MDFFLNLLFVNPTWELLVLEIYVEMQNIRLDMYDLGIWYLPNVFLNKTA